MDQWEREEEQVEADYAAGLITLQQRNEAIREIQRDYRGAAEESAENAYRDELGRW